MTVPTDLSDVVEFEAEIRTKKAGSVIMTCSVSNVTNEVTVALPASQWSVWSGKKGYWDLQLTYAGGEIVTYVAGDVVVTGDVTESVAL